MRFCLRISSGVVSVNRRANDVVRERRITGSEFGKVSFEVQPNRKSRSCFFDFRQNAISAKTFVVVVVCSIALIQGPTIDSDVIGFGLMQASLQLMRCLKFCWKFMLGVFAPEPEPSSMQVFLSYFQRYW
jgi:hypothetical protein